MAKAPGPAHIMVLAAAAVLLAGCATTIAGSPQAATGLASGTAAPTTGRSTSPTTSSSTATTVTTGSRTEIRPMPPLTGHKPPTTSGGGATGTGTGTGTGSQTTGSNAPVTTGTVAGVDIGSVLDDLAADHVAAVNSKADVTALASVAKTAREQGLELSVVSIGSTTSDPDAATIADDLFSATGGTLLVLTPSTVTSRSDQLTDPQRKAANKQAGAGKDDVDAVTKFVAAALGAASTGGANGSATTAGSTGGAATGSATGGMVEGVDIDGVVGALADDHVAVEKGVTDTDSTEMAEPVQRAKDGGLDLYVVVLKDDVPGHLYDVAKAVQQQTAGTVIIISPGMYAVSSDTATDAEMDAALDAAQDASSYLELVDDMVDSLLG